MVENKDSAETKPPTKKDDAPLTGTPSTLTPNATATAAGRGGRGRGRGRGGRGGRGWGGNQSYRRSQVSFDENKSYELKDISFKLGQGCANHYVTHMKMFAIYAGIKHTNLERRCIEEGKVLDVL